MKPTNPIVLMILSLRIVQCTGPDFARREAAKQIYLGVVTCNKDHISSSLRELSQCEPREKVIAVSWPNHTTVDHVSPSHVTVLRCSGGCHTNHQSCVASRKKSRQVAVMLGRCEQENRGRCEKECNSVQVEDEVECECGCRQKREECLENQEWKSETCECLCKDRKARREC